MKTPNQTPVERQGLIASPGYRFILPLAVVFLLGLALNSTWLSLLGLVGAGFFAYFFRDPERAVPQEPDVIVAPADGKVVAVDEVQEDKFLGRPAKRVGIFMNVLDVHVNRSPVAATVVVTNHQPGQCQPVCWKGAEEVNEKQTTLLEGAEGRQLLVVQIAGILARRIIPYVHPGQTLAKGERLGMICFGSRVDLYLPLDAEIMVQVGDRVQAGSSVLARWWPDAA
ncbi:MAG: phosphatidylserine decarboxylase family protein [Syntrophales bacterium]|nr:phosphatidylserine decarboxylase family protein [Syntrophales bacterium]MDD5642237.1 phosphatidylserine decarboxylase family protein [Syntrophales bacterium]